jgi:hypothetical protein
MQPNRHHGCWRSLTAWAEPSITEAPHGLYAGFTGRPAVRHGAFSATAPTTHLSQTGAGKKAAMTDIIVILAGTGGILLMALYALGCERI